MRHIGFTGTQLGMTEKQKRRIKIWLETDFTTNSWFHHGDCIGADAEANRIACQIGYKIHIHPPENSNKRAFCEGDEEDAPLPYLERNHVIVDSVDFMLACPKESEEVLRSGTWATIRYSWKQRKPIFIVSP